MDLTNFINVVGTISVLGMFITIPTTLISAIWNLESLGKISATALICLVSIFVFTLFLTTTDLYRD